MAVELVAAGFSFPTSLVLAADGTAYVAESGLPFGGAPPGGRVWRLGRDGVRTLFASELSAPVTGLALVDGTLVVSEGGRPARISRIAADGERTTVLEGFPGPGNYHLNMVAQGPDGRLYFALGAMTNTGIVGLDAYELGWLRRLPHAHDLPGYDVELAGVNVETDDPLDGGRVRTGAFVPFGVATEAGCRIEAAFPCTASVIRCDAGGGEPELVAWGLRNAFGIGFVGGRLFALDQGPDDRGSRPVGNAPDALFEIRSGAWYGWPDYVAGDPITDGRYRPERGPAPAFVLANHAELPVPERPRARFPPHAAATKLDVAPDGSLVVALFGDEAPLTAPEGVRAGRALARVDIARGSVDLFEQGTFLRPIDVRFDHDGRLHVLDFGRFEADRAGVVAAPGTGAVWRVR